VLDRLRPSAWQSLGVVSRALYVELASRYHGANNGEIIFSVRQAAHALHVSKDTAARGFEDLQARGFIAVRRKGGFNLKEQKGQATEWRLTEFGYGSDALGTKEFARWSEGGDYPVIRGPRPLTKGGGQSGRGRANLNPTPLVNYKRPATGTVKQKKEAFESHQKDQNVAFPPHESHQKDRSVPVVRLAVSPEGPCSKFEGVA
jgi:hypothetical protein